jgi:TolB-like protein
MSLFSELKRRNVFRVVAAYVVLSWLLLQIVDVVSPILQLPDVFAKGVLVLIGLGFIAAVVFSWVFEMTPEGIKKESEIDPQQSITAHTGRKLDYVTIGMIVVGIVFVLLQQQRQPAQPAGDGVRAEFPAEIENGPEEQTTEARVEVRSIAVLPFVNMSSDPENEYFADGLSEELLNQLAQIPSLMVAGRTSSFSFKGKNQDLREIGKTLSVANVLEGSVRRQGNQVRVTAQMIRVSDGFHLWSNTYDRLMDDVFAIQDDISVNVANALKIVLDEDARARMQDAGVRNVEAFVAFQKGKELFQQAHGSAPLMETLRKGLVEYKRAIKLVPKFGAAYWQMTDYFGHVILQPSSTVSEKKEALLELRKVLDAAYEYSESLNRRAFIDVDRVLFSDDWTPLKDRIEKALATTGCPDPTWIEIATWIGYAKEAEQMWARQARCEPLSSNTPIQIAHTLLYQGKRQAALDLVESAEAVHGTSAWYAATRQKLLITLGRGEEALALAPAVTVDREFFGMGAEALPLAYLGDIDGAHKSMKDWIAENGPNAGIEITIYAAMGDRENANRRAADLDASPGGPMVLLEYAGYCSCGAPFDLEATPNFRARIQESDIEWPLQTLIKYPAKDW